MLAHDATATSVVIVNYRTKELTLAAVHSALREPEVREVVVVDNASGDGSADFLRASFPASAVRVVEAASNLGFGRAVNLAVTTASSPLILLLNSDATLVPGAVAGLATSLLEHPDAGVVAPVILEADGQTLQPDAHGAFPGLIGHRFRRAEPPATRTPDWVSGVAMMLRTEDFVEVGGFDEDFEMYLEDVDLCRRLRQSGKLVLKEPGATVVHLGGRSWVSSADKRAKYQHSKLLYFRKGGAGPAKVALLQTLRFARVCSAHVGRFLGKRRSKVCPERHE